MAKFRVVCMNAQSSDGIVTESLPKTDLIRAAVWYLKNEYVGPTSISFRTSTPLAVWYCCIHKVQYYRHWYFVPWLIPIPHTAHDFFFIRKGLFLNVDLIQGRTCTVLRMDGYSSKIAKWTSLHQNSSTTMHIFIEFLQWQPLLKSSANNLKHPSKRNETTDQLDLGAGHEYEYIF